jgi:hypothetical protein
MSWLGTILNEWMSLLLEPKNRKVYTSLASLWRKWNTRGHGTIDHRTLQVSNTDMCASEVKVNSKNMVFSPILLAKKHNPWSCSI